MQDDQKRPTVEDQELANMIANLNNSAPQTNSPMPVETAPTRPPVATATPDPVSSLPPVQPKTTGNPVSSLPPIQPKQVNDNPAASFTPPTTQPTTATANPAPASNNFKDIKPTPGLPPLPTNPAANNAQALPPLPSMQKPASQGSSDLASIKQKTLNELRPLVAKLDLPAEEKFDTLLLLIRSTDDKSLISQAYEAAEKITDETRRASALLDVVKEIDYFESNNK